MLKSGSNPAFHHGGLHVKEHIWGQVTRARNLRVGKCVVIFTYPLVDSGQII